MPTSDWGDWLPRAVESASPDGVALWYLGCNGFAVKAADGTTLFVDPYLGTGDPPRTVRMIPVPFEPRDVGSVDAVLATHEHTDHVHGPSQGPLLAGTGASFYGPDASVDVTRDEDWTDRWAVDDGQFVTLEVGDSFDVGGMSVHVETANDPDAEHPVSFLLEYGDVTVFHGGDTKPSPEFSRIGRSYDVDLGILAFGSAGMVPDKETREPARKEWYNDEDQVVKAASDLRVDRLLPTHWDMWKGLTADPTALTHHVRSFEHPRELVLAEIGDRIDLTDGGVTRSFDRG